MTIEVRHLRCFLAVAEERHLSRAAARLHMSQPAMSRTLAQLERSLGVRLADRSTHHVTLTTAGVEFERTAFDAVRAFERALAFDGGPTPPIRLGHSWSAGTFLSTMMRAWGAVDRPCAVDVVRCSDRTAGLTSGIVDAGLTRGPFDRRRFKSVELAQEPRTAVLPVGHPLAARRRVRLDELASSGLRLVQTEVGVTTPDLWPADGRPDVGRVVATVDDWLVAIAAGEGFGVSVRSTAVLHPHPDVRYVALSDAEPVSLWLAWPSQGRHPHIDEFVRVAVQSLG